MNINYIVPLVVFSFRWHPFFVWLSFLGDFGVTERIVCFSVILEIALCNERR